MQGFDRNTVIGILLIGAIMFGWLYWSAPSQEEIAERKRVQDSLAALEIKKDTTRVVSLPDTLSPVTAKTDTLSLLTGDSLKKAEEMARLGVFYPQASGVDSSFTLENEHFILELSNRGGQIVSVLLKDYKTYDGKPLYLFPKGWSNYGLSLVTEKTQLNTSDFYFIPEGKSGKVSGKDSLRFSFKLPAGEGKHLVYTYTIRGNDFMVGFDIGFEGLAQVIPRNQSLLDFSWDMATPSQEKTIKNQRDASTIYFKYLDEEADYLSEMHDDSLGLKAKVKWLGFKQQFFSTLLIAKEHFDNQGSFLSSYMGRDDSLVKKFHAIVPISYEHQPSEQFSLNLYLGPNHYQTLKAYDQGLEKIIPLGWGIFGWVNKFLVIPIFNFFDNLNWNYGIIILCLTLIIKMILFPIAYKTYLSSAKMRVLKPELDELSKKFENRPPLEKQQAQMALYKKAGVNPLAGCIPVLLQFPILIALVRFFPASIELRQQAFLWADDLSTYDSIWDFGKIPIIETIYGDHMSLFAILMTGSTLLYTFSNSQLMGQNNQMPGMKYMIYLMPIMFLPFMNNFSAGLSYYYFLANMISFAQTWLMGLFMDENKLRAVIEENKKKPVKVSRWQKRLDEMQRQQRERVKQVKKKK